MPLVEVASRPSKAVLTLRNRNSLGRPSRQRRSRRIWDGDHSPVPRVPYAENRPLETPTARRLQKHEHREASPSRRSDSLPSFRTESLWKAPAALMRYGAQGGYGAVRAKGALSLALTRIFERFPCVVLELLTKNDREPEKTDCHGSVCSFPMHLSFSKYSHLRRRGARCSLVHDG
jgi:hypothetical protein